MIIGYLVMVNFLEFKSIKGYNHEYQSDETGRASSTCSDMHLFYDS